MLFRNQGHIVIPVKYTFINTKRVALWNSSAQDQMIECRTYLSNRGIEIKDYGHMVSFVILHPSDKHRTATELIMSGCPQIESGIKVTKQLYDKSNGTYKL